MSALLSTQERSKHLFENESYISELHVKANEWDNEVNLSLVCPIELLLWSSALTRSGWQGSEGQRWHWGKLCSVPWLMGLDSQLHPFWFYDSDVSKLNPLNTKLKCKMIAGYVLKQNINAFFCLNSECESKNNIYFFYILSYVYALMHVHICMRVWWFALKNSGLLKQIKINSKWLEMQPGRSIRINCLIIPCF